MGSKIIVMLVLSLGLVSAATKQGRAPVFEENFSVMWADDHVHTSGDNGSVVELMLDRTSGSAFSTNRKYLFGFISMDLKLVPGDSAGVVTAYYLASETENRDELDFEFLGNRTGEPYALQTNIYSNGYGGREQRILLWFDPSAEYHSYSFLWNKHHIVFYVDKTPIRVHAFTESTKYVYPNKQPMRLISSIWNADGWATRSGLEKINWNGAPFTASYREFVANACIEGDQQCISTTERFWWDEPNSWKLTPAEQEKLAAVKGKLMIYDYCVDTSRYPKPPPECTV